MQMRKINREKGYNLLTEKKKQQQQQQLATNY